MTTAVHFRDHIYGIFLGFQNQNGRIYPAKQTLSAFRSVLDRSLLIITLGRPSDMTIPLDKTCGIVTSVAREGDLIAVEWKLLKTPLGETVERMKACDVKLKLNAFGMAKISQDGIVNDYQPTGLYLSIA